MSDFSKTDVDHEAVSFDEPEAAPPEPERSDGEEPDWAGTLPRQQAVNVPEPTPTPTPAPVPASAPAPAPTPEPVDPLELAETNHRKEAVEVPDEPRLDQLAEDQRIIEQGRKAGWTPGATAPSTEDRALKIGLWVVVGLVALLVLGLCVGLGSMFVSGPEEAAAIEE